MTSLVSGIVKIVGSNDWQTNKGRHEDLPPKDQQGNDEAGQGAASRRARFMLLASPNKVISLSVGTVTAQLT
jgi:hypothetical protein